MFNLYCLLPPPSSFLAPLSHDLCLFSCVSLLSSLLSSVCAVQRSGPIIVRVLEADTALDLEFAQSPSVGELFDAIRKRLGEVMQHPGLKVYFRMPNGQYVGSYPSDASISWKVLDWDGNVCFARVGQKSPPSSPERPVVKPRHDDSARLVERLTAKLANVAIDAAPART